MLMKASQLSVLSMMEVKNRPKPNNTPSIDDKDMILSNHSGVKKRLADALIFVSFRQLGILRAGLGC